jgi:hypothetical protein
MRPIHPLLRRAHPLHLRADSSPCEPTIARRTPPALAARHPEQRLDKHDQGAADPGGATRADTRHRHTGTRLQTRWPAGLAGHTSRHRPLTVVAPRRARVTKGTQANQRPQAWANVALAVARYQIHGELAHVKRRIITLLISVTVATLGLNAIPALAQYSTVTGLGANGCLNCGLNLGSDTGLNSDGTDGLLGWSTGPTGGNGFSNGTPLQYYRIWVPYNISPAAGNCTQNMNASSDFTSAIDYLYMLHDSYGATPIVQFDNQPSPTTSNWSTETTAQRTSVTDIMNCEGAYGIYFPVYFEGFNEPDLNWGNCGAPGYCLENLASPYNKDPQQEAADYTINDIWGGQASSNHSDAHYLAGTFGGVSTSFDNDYYTELSNFGEANSVDAWDIHDYTDLNTSETLNYCYDTYTSGNPPAYRNAYSGCSLSSIASFISWSDSHTVLYGGSTWVTEAADGPPNFPSGYTHQAWVDARAATDLEAVAHQTGGPALWYQYQDAYGSENATWEVALLAPGYSGNSAGCERGSWYVIAQHESTDNAINSALNNNNGACEWR